MHYNRFSFKKIIKVFSSAIGILLVFNVTSASVPALVTEWSFPINSLPKDIIFFDIEDDRLAEIAIALDRNQIIVLNNTGDSILWSLKTISPIVKLAVLYQQIEPTSLLIAAAPPYLLAINRNGKIVWQIFLKGLITHSKLWLETGNFIPQPGNELLVVTQNFFFIIAPNGKISHQNRLPIYPKQIEIGNIDNDSYDEILLSDFNRLIAYQGDGRIAIDLSLANANLEINRTFDIYDIDSDRIEEIVAVTSQPETNEDKIINWVNCFSANGSILWRYKVKTDLRTVRVLRGEIYLGGIDSDGEDCLTKLDRTGEEIKTVILSKNDFPQFLYSPVAKFNRHPIGLQEIYQLGNLLLLSFGWREAGELKVTNLRLFSTNLDAINLTHPEYFSNLPVVYADRNQELINLRIGSINGDTLPDVLITRRQNGEKYAVDCLVNRCELLARAEREMWNSFRNALRTFNQTDAKRFARRAQILAANFGNNLNANRTYDRLLREWKTYRRIIIARTVSFTVGIILVFVALGFFFIRPMIRKRIWRLAQVETKPISTVVRIATELVALNHNYIVKGNLNGAYHRLIEIIHRYGLHADRDLSHLLTKTAKSTISSVVPTKPIDFLIYYRRFVKRLTKESRTANLINLTKKICSDALGDSLEIFEASLNRNEYIPEQLEKQITPSSKIKVSFFYLINRDFPNIYQETLLFWDTNLYNWLEHLCTDHLRYARSYAHFVFDYESPTEWNRKLVLHLISDATTQIDFSQRISHLLDEFEELKIAYQDYIQLPTDQAVLYYPNEKIWIKILDLISVLNSIIFLNA